MADYHPIRRAQIESLRAYIPEAIERLSWSRDRVLEEQTRQLRAYVGAAQQGSRFMAGRLGHLEASKLDLADLPKIPPIRKADIMSNWDDFVTDDRLHLDEVNAHLRRVLSGEQENPYYLDEYYVSATGGSSGTRGVFVWDPDTVRGTAAITTRMEALFDLENPPQGPRRTAIVCAGSFVHGSRFLFAMVIDPEREVRVIPASTPTAEMVAQLNELQPDRLIGYSSHIEELCAEALDGHLRIRPQRVSANSEPLTPHARQMSLEAWGVNVHNQWGSVEIGLSASEGDSFSGMSLAEDYLIFEPVDADDQPVSDLEQADRLLVTKLYGDGTMPMIRYELTDTVVIDASENPDVAGCRRIKEIKGRADDWFVYGDTKIHPMIFRGVLGQDPHISEYQVQQTDVGARALAIAHGHVSIASLRSDLESALAKAGLAEPEVSVEIVDDLPRHPETNKLKRFVPLH